MCSSSRRGRSILDLAVIAVLHSRILWEVYSMGHSMTVAGFVGDTCRRS